MKHHSPQFLIMISLLSLRILCIISIIIIITLLLLLLWLRMRKDYRSSSYLIPVFRKSRPATLEFSSWSNRYSDIEHPNSTDDNLSHLSFTLAPGTDRVRPAEPIYLRPITSVERQWHVPLYSPSINPAFKDEYLTPDASGNDEIDPVLSYLPSPRGLNTKSILRTERRYYPSSKVGMI